MLFKVYNYHSSAWVDISDYVVGSEDIPFISRNSDWTLRIETWTMEIAGSIQADLPAGYSFGINDKIKIEKDSTFLLSGYIADSYYDYEQQRYVLEVKSPLYKLQNEFLDYPTFYTIFPTGDATQFWIDGGYPPDGYRCVQVLWALEKAFTVCGLTLDVPSGIKTTQLFTRVFQKAAPPYSGNKVITYADLFFEEFQLYCLGHDYAIHPPVEPVVNCSDFVSEIFTSLRFTVKQTGDDAFQLIALTSNYTVADDDKFGYESRAIQQELFDAGFSYTTPNINHISGSDYSAQRELYYSATETQLPEIASGGGDKIIPMPNFSIFFAGEDSSYPIGSCTFSLTNDLIVSDVSINASLNMAAIRYQADVMDYTKEDITTNATNTFNTVVENFIDMENQTSRIIQETYA